MDSAAYVFPAVRGTQAQREYYISMVPLDVMSKIFQFADEDLPPEIRAQRILNKSRIPEIRDYILSNPDSYVFSALTVSVDGNMEFMPADEMMPQVGAISISMTSRFLINDGQHRRAAIAEAIKMNPSLKNEHISVVFYRDEGLLRSQQMFSDLNRYAIKPTKSINILFNSREESSIIAKRVIDEVGVFKGLVEKERTAISNRSKALFTLSAICTATSELLNGSSLSTQNKIDLAKEYWSAVGRNISEWNMVKSGKMKSSAVRKDYICSLSITLVALGHAGNALIQNFPETWANYLEKLSIIDWRKTNPAWDNLVFVNGRVAANRSTQKAMSSYKLNTLVQLIPLSEHATTYGISVLAYLTKGTSQSVARILHSGRCVLANNSIVMDGHFKAPIDIVPRGVNLGILLLIIEQENDGYTHLFHSKQEAELHRRKLMYTMNNDAVKRQLLGCANRSFTTLYFLWCSSTFFDFLLGERNNNLL